MTAFIKIQHMPAEILLKEQKQPISQNINQTNTMRGHHFNAMMAQQRSSNTEGQNHLSQFANTSANIKMSPYGNSQIKSWGRPVKSQYQ